MTTTGPLPAINLPPDFHLSCYHLDPIQDPRWADLVARHPKASVFHTVGWLRALRHTYGYEPVAFTTSPPTGQLTNGIVLCRINSWLTGRRLVSLPFSDHCEPLCDSPEELNFLVRYLLADSEHRRWKYMEIRPIHHGFGPAGDGNSLFPASRFLLHTVNLRPELDEIFRGFDKDSVQRRIRRAERVDLVEKCGRSEQLLKDFYGLFVVTRRRHRLPPIPCIWFQNLIKWQGDLVEFRVAYEKATPVAGILTLHFRDKGLYKYGASDTRFNKLGATPWLIWRAMIAAKTRGAAEFDLGRTELDNPGLLEFKSHWDHHPRELVYWRFPSSVSPSASEGWKLRLAKGVFSRLPTSLLKVTGRLLYRHIG